MKIHYLQHVPFEGLGSMGRNFGRRGHSMTATQLYDHQPLPETNAFDWLIIMGGPMGLGDEAQYRWMTKEKELIASAIHADKIVLGICLGAQLIADVLGADVYPNPHREIGWHPLFGTEHAHDTILRDVIPSGSEVFHWHGDTFDIPSDGVLLASSQACPHQGFIIDNRIVGLQFHLETTVDSVRSLIENCGHELVESKFVQSETDIMARISHCAAMNTIMDALLNRLESHWKTSLSA